MTGGRRITALGLVLRFAVSLLVFAATELVSERMWPQAAGMPVWLVAATTGLLGILFALVGRRIDRIAARIALGNRSDGYTAGRNLLRRMSTTLPLEEVLPALAEITGRTLQAERSEVRLLLPDGRSWTQVWPDRSDPEGAPVVVQVRHGGEAVGEIEADVPGVPVTNRERRLLLQLASPAGLAMSTVRLTVELRHRADQLQQLAADIAESNRRIGRAGRIEADRIGAEIDARVDPHLIAAEDLIERAARMPAQDPAGFPLIDQARDEVGLALDELRSLARRIYPPRLGDGGLAAALEGWQLSARTGIDVRIDADDAPLRADPAVQSCLYFLIVAALAQRPSPLGPRQEVTVDVRADRVTVRVLGPVVDSAPDREADAPTIAAIRDRVDAFGGELTVRWIDRRRTFDAWLALRRPDLTT